MKKLYGLLGFPLSHSFSKRYFDQKFKNENIEANFVNFELENAIDILTEVKSRPNLKGFTITIPHKQTIIPFLDNLDEAPLKIGAVNCVKIDRTGDSVRLVGYNSDYVGFSESIRPLLKKHHKKALVLGTGGASKAVVYALNQLGVETQLVSRRKTEATISYEEITSETLQEYTVVVNSTPLGTFPKVEGFPDIPYEFLNENHLLYDLVYNPEVTTFLKKGEERGASIKNGMDMLELQAIEAWEIWEERPNK